MSISNTVSKVEEFEYDNASETTIDNELEKSSSTTEGKTAVREEFDASSKSLDATQLYLGEIGFSPLLTAEEEVLYLLLKKKSFTPAEHCVVMKRLVSA